MRKRKQKFPPGWDEARVRRVLEHYESQTEDEAIAEDEAAFAAGSHTAMKVPADLVPAVRDLIAERERRRAPTASGSGTERGRVGGRARPR